jgi:hypothetical protein
MNTSNSGGAVRTAGVAASNAVLNYTPQGQSVNSVSSIVDSTVELGEMYGWWDIGGAPKAGEVFNNAGRAVGVVGDFIAGAISPETDCNGRRRPNRGWESVRNFVDHMRNDQGSLSRALVERGEWWGDRLGDVYNRASGETARAEILERRRLQLLARRRNRR